MKYIYIHIIYSACLNFPQANKKALPRKMFDLRLCPDLRIGMGLEKWRVFLRWSGDRGDLGEKKHP